jgi:hypothetical protein
MMRAAWLLGLVISLVGCTAVQRDLQGALTRAQAAQSAGLLGPTDPLVPCLQYFAGAASDQGQLALLKGPFAGIIDVGTDLYILDVMAQAGGTSDALDAMCGPVAMKVLKNAGRRAPGL